MDIQIIKGKINSDVFKKIEALLKTNDLSFDSDLSYDCLSYIEDNNEIIACGFRYRNVLKYIAVDKNRQGENLSDTVVSNLISDAFSEGLFDLFLFTKPSKVNTFLSLGFSLIIESDNMAMLENKKDGINNYIDYVKSEKDKKCKNINGDKISSIVMNANPMTNGHKYLIETASKNSDLLYLFILASDLSEFSTDERLRIVKETCKDIENVVVVDGGNYIISTSTFPTYFIKDKTVIEKSQMKLDAEIFAKVIAPKLGIKERYVGTEPFSETTKNYNDALSETLPRYGIKLHIIDRYKDISASKVRQMIKNKESIDEIAKLVPETSLETIRKKYYV